MIKKIFRLLLLITCIALLTTGCSTSSKAKSSTTKKVDSSVVSNTHQEGTRSTDSQAVKKLESEYKNSIDIVFDDDTAGIEIISGEDPVEKAKDLAGITKKRVHKLNIGGKTIESTRSIKSISINNSGKITDVDITSLQKKDSGQISTSEQVDVVREDKLVTKEKETSGANVWIFVGIAALLLVFAYFALRSGIFFINKRKEV